MKTRFLLFALLLLGARAGYGQGLTCEDSEPFCTGTIYTFPAGTTGVAQPGAYYGCLLTQPAPAWYHMLIEDPGSISIYMYSTPLVDIDFICWGPYADPYDPCVTGLTSNKVVDCSYSPNPTEYCDIPNGQTGEYYVLLITNYSQQQCHITFSQTAGNGSTDCTILPPPTGNNGPLCVGETLELYAAFVVNAQYYWTGPGGFLSTQQNPVIPNVTLANAGNYSCTITVNGQSSDPSTTNVVIYSRPTAALLSPDTTVCPQTPAYAIFQLIGFGPFEITYTSGLNTYTATGLTGPQDTVFLIPQVNPTTYTFIQVEDMRCTNSILLTDMTVGLYPAATAQISGTSTICSGESGQLVFNLTGTPPWTITYTQNGVNTQTVVSNQTPYYLTVFPTTTTTYAIQSAHDIHCDATVGGTAVITVEPTPVADAGDPQSIPYGTYTILSGQATGGSGNYSYHWEPASKVTNPNVPQPQTVNLTTSTQFTLTVEDNASDCFDTEDVMITVTGGALGCFPAAHPPVICADTTSDLVATASGGTGDYTYLWTSDPPGFSSDIPNPTVSPTQTTIYTVRVDDGFNFVEESVTVTVHDLPVPDAGDDITILNGLTTTLHGSASMGSGNYSYHWEPADSLVDPNVAEPQTHNLYTTNLFSLTVTDLTHGCKSHEADQMTVTVGGDILSINPTATPDDICLGESTQLRSLAGGGSGTYYFTWSSASGFNSTESDPEFTPEEPGTYIITCRVFDGYNIKFKSVAVTVRPLPYVNLGSPDTIVCVYDTITLDAGNPGAQYQWSNGSTERTIRVGSTGIGFDTKTFSVRVTNQELCEAGDEMTIVFDFAMCNGVEDVTGSNEVLLYPNPGQGNIHLRFEHPFVRGFVTMTDVLGRELVRLDASSFGLRTEELVIDMEGYPEGIYFFRLQGEGFGPMTLKYMLVR